jgi:hypothetical protein
MTFWFIFTYFVGLDFWHTRIIPDSHMSLNDIIEIGIYGKRSYPTLENQKSVNNPNTLTGHLHQ